MKHTISCADLSMQQLEKEIRREGRRRDKRGAFRSTVSVLLVIGAAAVLAATLWFPVLRIAGDSMSPLLQSGQIVAAFRTEQLAQGDIAAFYYENQILVKRVIAVSGDWIEIDAQGQVFVNGTLLQEDYLADAVLDPGDQAYPYQVPDGSYFVMGDNRAVLADSRSTDIGCVASEKLVGKIIFRLWPLDRLEYLG